MKKAIVTGGAGFIGSYMSKKLVEEGYYLFIFDNLFRGKKSNIQDLLDINKAELFIVDLSEYSCKSILSDVIENNPEIDLIIHYAAINGTQYFYDKPQEVSKVNSISTYYLMETLLENKDKLNIDLKIYFSSSSETYGEPFNIPTSENDLTYFRINEERDSYAISKMMSEFYIKLYSKKLNINYVILRIFNVYGPKMVGTKYGQVVPEFLSRLKGGEYPLKLIGDGSQKRSFIYISDHIELTWRLIQSNFKNQVINLGNDQEISILNLAKKLMILLKIDPNFEYTKDRKGDHKRRKPDITKLKSVVGDYEFVSLDEGLKKCIEFDG